nr:hypothetical protein [Tanacetum cinerariifolium]
MRNFMQNLHDGPPGEDKEYEATTDTELPSTKDIQPFPVQEPPQNSDIRQLIREEEKEFLCIHDDVDDLIESALNSKLLLINSNFQHLDKKKQEVKNIVEQPAERGNRNIQSFQNFRVIHKSSISLNTSQISSIHAIAPILSTKEPEHLLSMGYVHLSITLETESVEVIESNAENLLPIPSKCEVTLEDEIECDMPAKDVCSPVFTTFSNPLFKDNDDLDSKEIRLIENLLYDNSSPRPPEELNAEIADTIIESIPSLPIPVWDGDSQREEIDIVTKTDDVLPLSVENDDDYDPFLKEVDLFLSDNSIPPGIENVADDPEGDIRFLEELIIDDSILSHESSDSNFEDNPSIP